MSGWRAESREQNRRGGRWNFPSIHQPPPAWKSPVWHRFDIYDSAYCMNPDMGSAFFVIFLKMVSGADWPPKGEEGKRVAVTQSTNKRAAGLFFPKAPLISIVESASLKKKKKKVIIIIILVYCCYSYGSVSREKELGALKATIFKLGCLSCSWHDLWS